MMRVAAAFSVAAVVAGQQGAWNLHLLDKKTYPLAQCLDGSPGGFYFSPGWGSGANSWMIHTQGGGWCVSLEGEWGDERFSVNAHCVARSQSQLGSSTQWPQTSFDADGGPNGMISANATINPNLYNWNKVFIGYCDGGSYAGGVLGPVNVNGTIIYFRGHYILEAVYDTLLSSYGVNAAKEVVIKGCSAGGLAVYLHADYLAKKINTVNPSARVVAAPDAGFFMDVPSIYGTYLYTPIYQAVFQFQNASYWVNDACISDHPHDDQWKCFMAPYTLPYIKTPLFISNSLGDSWQLNNIMALGCTPSLNNCNSSQLTYFNNFRTQMLAALQPALSSSTDGAFLQECVVHVVEDVSGSWNGILVQNQTQTQTFWAWYQNLNDALHAAVDGPWNSNPTCGLYQYGH